MAMPAIPTRAPEIINTPRYFTGPSQSGMLDTVNGALCFFAKRKLDKAPQPSWHGFDLARREEPCLENGPTIFFIRDLPGDPYIDKSVLNKLKLPSGCGPFEAGVFLRDLLEDFENAVADEKEEESEPSHLEIYLYGLPSGVTSATVLLANYNVARAAAEPALGPLSSTAFGIMMKKDFNNGRLFPTEQGPLAHSGISKKASGGTGIKYTIDAAKKKEALMTKWPQYEWPDEEALGSASMGEASSSGGSPSGMGSPSARGGLNSGGFLGGQSTPGAPFVGWDFNDISTLPKGGSWADQGTLGSPSVPFWTRPASAAPMTDAQLDEAFASPSPEA